MKVDNLIKSLVEFRSILAHVNEAFWIKKIDNVLKRKIDLNSCIEILSWYGGMNSLNDLIICKENGHTLKDEYEDDINKKIEISLDIIYEETKKIKKNIE